jgi:thimet oligopeptidase
MPAEIPTLTAASEDIHTWEAGGATSASALSAWVSARLAAHEAALAALLAVEGPRTPENSLRQFDEAIEQLNLAGAQAGVLNSVAPDKAVRDQAQDEAQRVSMAGSALSLNRAVYDALSAINLDGASPATKHYVERTLLGYRLAGVDKDQATRDQIRRCTRRPPATRSSSAATSRKAARRLKPPLLSSTAFRPTTWPAISPTKTASSQSALTSPTCSR